MGHHCRAQGQLAVGRHADVPPHQGLLRKAPLEVGRRRGGVDAPDPADHESRPASEKEGERSRSGGCRLERQRLDERPRLGGPTALAGSPGDDGELFAQSLQSGDAFGRPQRKLTPRPLQGADAEAVETPARARQLVGMTAVLDHQRRVDQSDVVARGDPQPEVVVLAHR